VALKPIHVVLVAGARPNLMMPLPSSGRGRAIRASSRSGRDEIHPTADGVALGYVFGLMAVAAIAIPVRIAETPRIRIH
jgi:hypothetical protein